MGIFVDRDGPTRLLKILSGEELLWDNRHKSKSSRKNKTDSKHPPKKVALLEYLSCKNRAKTKKPKTKADNPHRQPSPPTPESNHNVAPDSQRN